MDYNEKIIQLERELAKEKKMRSRNAQLFNCCLKWSDLLEAGGSLESYFRDRGYEKIAIYGAGSLAESVVVALNKYEYLRVSYMIDQSAESMREKHGLRVYTPDEFANAEDVDMVIVTAISFYDDICEKLLRIRPEIPVVSLEKMIQLQCCDNG